MPFQGEIISSAQIEVDLAALRRNNVAVDQFITFTTNFRGLDVIVDCDKITVVAESLSTLVEIEEKFKEMICDTTQNSTSVMDPYMYQDQSLLTNAANDVATSNAYDIGAVGVDADSSSLEWLVTPFPQPQNGYTVSENVDEEKYTSVIRRKFCFPEGQIHVSGNVIKYSSFECVINLPQKPTGLEVDALLKEAFKGRKLFYVGRDSRGSGFVIQSAYQLLPSNKSEQTISGSKLTQMRTKLHDLGIELSKDSFQTISPESSPIDAIVPEPLKRQQEPQFKPARKSVVTEKPLKSSSVYENASSIDKSLRFPQPDGLVLNCEFHKKDLSGFEGAGAIHMYFRFDGGRVSNEYGETVQYPSYIKTACLPGNLEGRRLYAMIEEAAKSKKLFVVAHKYREFKLRSKVRLLNSDDYPQGRYLQLLLEELLKLEIQPLTFIPPLPTEVQAHHGESSDDEKEEEKLEALKKGGPFEQPEKGMMRLEKDPRKLKGFAACGAIMVYVRFAGGKMKIKGYKPSKSFEIQYSQANIVAALPGSDQGKRMAAMLHTAFQRRQLFIVEKRDGEPSFRVRPKVHLITAEHYPKNGYLNQLTRQLLSLGIPEPSETEVANLVLHDSKSAQQGSGLPPTSPITAGNDRLNMPVIQPHHTQPMQRNTGARPKQRMCQVNRGKVQTAMQGTSSDSMQHSVMPNSSSNSAKQTCDDEDKCPICLGSLSQMPRKKLGCGHEFHQACVDMALKAQPNNCPYCKQPVSSSNSSSVPNGFQAPQMTRVTPTPLRPNITYGNHASHNLQNRRWRNRPFQQAHQQNHGTNNTGIKLPGVMNTHVDGRSLPGYEGCGTIVICYNVPPGIQQNGHSNPGQNYDGTDRKAYLPDNSEGKNLSQLLRQAFDGGLTFTVGRSQTTGRDNQIIWNGIPHKTNIRGGKQSFGYPDKDYLDELRRTLSSKGIQ